MEIETETYVWQHKAPPRVFVGVATPWEPDYERMGDSGIERVHVEHMMPTVAHWAVGIDFQVTHGAN